tara:strand:+ start:17421 stop:18566 length:1146 start_codon:yes stop_codon:yes gene_type:complete
LRFLITILLSVTVYSQDENSLINKKNILLKEIELSKKTLISAKNQKIISTKELQALNAYIKARTNLKNTILQQRDSIELYKQEILNKIQINNQKISSIKQSYKSLIREIYLNDFGINLVSFIFSTSTFKDKISKYVYYKEKEQYRQNLLNELDYLQNELISFNNNLNTNINTKDTLLKEFNLEKDSLEILKKKKENLTISLTKQEKRLSDFIKLKKKEAQQIESEIIELQKQMMLSENYQKLDIKFEAKIKNIPWPVKKGVLLSEFGHTDHKNLPGIKIFNNGIEIGVEKDENVQSVFEGVVSKILFMQNGLKSIIIRHGNYLTVYINLKDVSVKIGDIVSAQDKIGIVFSSDDSDTGVLGFQIWKGVEKLNPMNWLHNNQ